jgi:tumor protein p53-inducible protein 3
LEYQARLRDAVYQYAVVDHFSKHDGTLKVFVDKAFNWEDIIDTHKYLESIKSMGKIVIKVTKNQ